MKLEVFVGFDGWRIGNKSIWYEINLGDGW